MEFFNRIGRLLPDADSTDVHRRVATPTCRSPTTASEKSNIAATSLPHMRITRGPLPAPTRIDGHPISCILANISLHFSLDLWFERKFKPLCRGEAYLVRFVDDFVVSFQHLTDAEEFQRQLRERFARFNLELAEEKTRLLLFGRFATERCIRNGQKAETFEFLGYVSSALMWCRRWR